MEATTRRVGNDIVVEIKGEVDTAQVPSFRALLEGACAECTGSVILAADELGYLNSAAVGVLAAVQRRLKEQGRPALIVRHPKPAIARLLRITRLDTVLNVIRAPGSPCESVEDGPCSCTDGKERQ